jgi:hypothetical protein
MISPYERYEQEQRSIRQNSYAVAIGATLLIIGILRLLFHGSLFGILTQSYFLATFHALGGAMFLWEGLSPSLVSKEWNGFLGALFTLVAVVQLVMVLLGFYGLIGDMIVNAIVGLMSMSMSAQERVVPKRGESFMEALNWPFGR